MKPKCLKQFLYNKKSVAEIQENLRKQLSRLQAYSKYRFLRSHAHRKSIGAICPTFNWQNIADEVPSN